MKKIFLTGATGVMGTHALKELSKHPERYEITVLARDSKKNRKQLASFQEKGVRVIWGDLLDKETIAEGVSNADIVLHVGGMVSPAADWQPEKTIRTNVGSMQNIIEAALPRKNELKVVYIGSVSQYGPHNTPNLWGKSGDHLSAAEMDAYAYSKIESEKLLIESDLKWWVSLRQTAILHSGLLMKASDPISFHVPIMGVIEWVTAEDSGRVLERVCRDEVPDSFWNRCYNIGGGVEYRLTNYEFECKLLKAMGCPPPEKIFNANWFATNNFHGMWYEDSEELEEILHFRKGTPLDEYFQQMKRELPWYFSLAPIAPAFALKMFMRHVARTPELGPMWWIENNITPRINAAWGSKEAWESLPDWKGFDLNVPDKEQSFVNAQCTMHNAQSASRPGSIDNSVDADSSNGSDNPDPNAILKIRCKRCGHEYSLKVRTYAAGHRCPNCLRQSLKNFKFDKSTI